MAENTDTPPEKQENEEKEGEKKEKGTLEGIVNESLDFGKAAFNASLAALYPVSQAWLFPHLARDTSILAGAQVAADKTQSYRKGEKYTSRNFLESIAVGTSITAPLYYVYNAINQIPTESALGYLAKGAAWGGLAYPAFIGLYQSLDYIIRNRTFKGVGSYIKENYWPTLKYSWKYLLPFSLLNIFFVPPILQIPVSAILSYAFALIGAPKKDEVPEERKRDKTPYLVAATRVGGKLVKNTFSYLYEGAYGIGTGIKSIFSALAPKSKPTETKPAAEKPAEQPAS